MPECRVSDRAVVVFVFVLRRIKKRSVEFIGGSVSGEVSEGQ